MLSHQRILTLLALSGLLAGSGCVRKATPLQWTGAGQTPGRQAPEGVRQIERLDGQASFVGSADQNGALRLTQMVEGQPESAQEALETAASLLQSRHLLDARHILAGLDRFAPLQPKENRRAAEMWLQLGETKRAQAHLQLALQEEPADAPTLTAWASAQVALGQPEEGLRTMLRATRAAPEDFGLRRSAALLAIGLGKSEEALPLLVNLSPEAAPRVHREMAALHVRQGDFRQACLRLLSVFPPAQALNALGEMLAGSEEWPLAYQAFQTALADDPDDPAILLNLREAGWNFPPPASVDAEPLRGGCRSFLQRAARLQVDPENASRLADSSSHVDLELEGQVGHRAEDTFAFFPKQALLKSLFRFESNSASKDRTPSALGGSNRERRIQ
ncbi:MAG TPA: hypothetical protein VLU25_04630 [Acidobacteriota bacterium]|nr:hypothetical protein [Acidobacteriota bacterium]